MELLSSAQTFRNENFVSTSEKSPKKQKLNFSCSVQFLAKIFVSNILWIMLLHQESSWLMSSSI